MIIFIIHILYTGFEYTYLIPLLFFQGRGIGFGIIQSETGICLQHQKDTSSIFEHKFFRKKKRLARADLKPLEHF